MMMEGTGFEVVDIGINNSVGEYFAALEEHKPDILGMSALLTTTMPYMKVVIDEMSSQGIRDDYIVMVGGAPLNEEFAQSAQMPIRCCKQPKQAPNSCRSRGKHWLTNHWLSLAAPRQ